MAQKKTIIAIDIGSHSAKVAIAAVDKSGVKISRLESFRLPAGEQNVIEALKPWMEKNGFTNSLAVISLSGKDVIFQPFQLVPDDPRTPEQAAAMEVIKFNDMASETMIFDHSEFSLGKDDRRLLLAIARPSLLDFPLALAGAHDLQIEDIVPSPIAAFNALANNLHSDEGATLFVHAGHTTTLVAIAINKQLVFARAFSCGGQLFTNAIMDSTDASAAQAENTKHASGSLKPGTPHAEALGKAADTWFMELSSCLSVFKSLFPSDKSQVGSVLLSGGASQLDGLPEYLEGKLGAKVSNPGKADPDVDDGVPPEYAVCAGLAHSLTDEPAAGISLLPEYIRDDITSRGQLPFWYAAAACAAIILASSLIGGYMDLNRTKAHLSQKRSDFQTRTELAAQIEAVRMKNGKMKQMSAPLANLLQSTHVMASVIKTVAENRGGTEWITMVCDSESYFNPAMYSGDEEEPKRSRRSTPRNAKLKEQKEERVGMSSVIVEGFTRNSSLSSVSDLISELEALDFVESADLLSDDMLMELPYENMEQKLNAIRFVIELKVKQT